jgi:hypothetical protein
LGQEFPAAFQQRDCEEERAARNKGANILRHTLGLTQLLAPFTQDDPATLNGNISATCEKYPLPVLGAG